MRRFLACALVGGIVACAEPPAATPARPALQPTPTPAPKPVATALGELFAVAAVDDTVDIVGDRKNLALPSGGSLLPWKTKNQVFRSRGAAPVFEWQTAWRFAGNERPDIEQRDVTTSLPDADELAWRWIEDEHTWQSIVLGKPPLLTTRAVAIKAGATRPVNLARGIVVDEWFVEEDDSGKPATTSFTLRSVGPGTTENELRTFAALVNERARASQR